VLAVLVGVGVVVLAVSGSSSPRPTARRSSATDGETPATSTSASTATAASTSASTAAPASTTTSTAVSATDPDAVTGLFATKPIRDYLKTQDSDVNAAVYDLRTDRFSVYRPGALEYTASIVKVDILATLLHQAEKAGTSISSEEQDLATTMIENSDDDAASDLWDDIGQQAGLAKFNSLIPLSGTVPGTDGHWGGTTTTGADQVSLLRQLVQSSRALQKAAQTYELGLMENVESDQAWGISAGIPAGVTVALKNGWLPLEDDGDWQVNSIGWVHGDGRDYLVAVLTKNNDTESDGISTIEGLSPLVWSALAQG
jgi:beta-lactamase class A